MSDSIWDRLIYGSLKGLIKEADKLVDEIVRPPPEKKTEPQTIEVEVIPKKEEGKS